MHFIIVGMLGVAFIIAGVAVFYNMYTYKGGIVGILLGLIGLSFTGWLIVSCINSSGRIIPIYERTYQIQELKNLSGTSIQVIVKEDGSIFNLTAETSKIFPAGVVTFQKVRIEPKNGIYFDLDESIRGSWISGKPEAELKP